MLFDASLFVRRETFPSSLGPGIQTKGPRWTLRSPVCLSWEFVNTMLGYFLLRMIFHPHKKRLLYEDIPRTFARRLATSTQSNINAFQKEFHSNDLIFKILEIATTKLLHTRQAHALANTFKPFIRTKEKQPVKSGPASSII